MRIKAPANLNHIFPSSLFSNCVWKALLPLKNHKKQEAANPYKKLLDNLKDLISKNDTPP
jgi:hypothetical protein